jgi:hypothetical protein
MQILVKTAPGMLGSYSYEVAPEYVKAFTARPDIWWYLVPVDDVLNGSGWHKGGAWEAQVKTAWRDDNLENVQNVPRGPQPAVYGEAPEPAGGEDDGDEEADSRW